MCIKLILVQNIKNLHILFGLNGHAELKVKMSLCLHTKILHQCLLSKIAQGMCFSALNTLACNLARVKNIHPSRAVVFNQGQFWTPYSEGRRTFGKVWGHYFIVLTEKEVLLASGEQKPGVFLNTLQCLGQPLTTQICLG